MREVCAVGSSLGFELEAQVVTLETQRCNLGGGRRKLNSALIELVFDLLLLQGPLRSLEGMLMQRHAVVLFQRGQLLARFVEHARHLFHVCAHQRRQKVARRS
jgi:hypothetical protein